MNDVPVMPDQTLVLDREELAVRQRLAADGWVRATHGPAAEAQVAALTRSAEVHAAEKRPRFVAVRDSARRLGRSSPSRYNPPVNLPDLENEALKLPVADRARLAETLLESLDALSEEENRRLWIEEARRRDAELDADPSRGRPAEDVFRDARARIR
jgi:Putative addiction module component